MSGINSGNQGSGNQGGSGTQTDPNPTGASHTQANEEGKSPPAGSGADPKATPPAAAPRATPPNAYPKTSRQKAGVGRALHAFSPAWDGPRPVTVVGTFASREDLKAGVVNRVNGNIAFDGANEAKVLEHVRRRNSGNTFTSVEVYDALTPEQRLERMPALKHAADWRASWNGQTEPPVHFEWPALD